MELGGSINWSPIRVLVIDDSAFMRKAIREMLEQSTQVEVIGSAWNGKDALEQVEALKPDVVITDLYMPEMDGVDFIKIQMGRRPLPILLCSSADEDGDLVMAAMEAGAVEFVKKPTARALDNVYDMKQQLLLSVLAAALVPLDKLEIPKEIAPLLSGLKTPVKPSSGLFKAILIGVSTGGPRALRQLLPQLPAEMPVPVAIALHMPPGYTGPLAERLNALSQIEVVESADGVEMLPGRVVLAKSGLHTRLVETAPGRVETRLSREPKESHYHPSVDELFKSGAEAYNGRVLGIVMTGMGNDGTAGAAWIKAQGGVIFVEDESSSIVYGMPRSVVEAGLADRILPLDRLSSAILEAIQ